MKNSQLCGFLFIAAPVILLILTFHSIWSWSPQTLSSQSSENYLATIEKNHDTPIGLSHPPDPTKFHIFFFWHGASIPNLYMKAIRLAIYTHSTQAQVLLVSNELDATLLDIYRNEGYDARVVRYDLEQLTENSNGIGPVGPGRDFVVKYKAALIDKRLQATPVHLSDFMRLLLVYKFGGLYMDTDIFVMRNLEAVQNTLGVDSAGQYICLHLYWWNRFSRCNVRNIACACNCLFSFDTGHQFLRDALKR
jgi:hypothetical protein